MPAWTPEQFEKLRRDTAARLAALQRLQALEAAQPACPNCEPCKHCGLAVPPVGNSDPFCSWQCYHDWHEERMP